MQLQVVTSCKCPLWTAKCRACAISTTPQDGRLPSVPSCASPLDHPVFVGNRQAVTLPLSLVKRNSAANTHLHQAPHACQEMSQTHPGPRGDRDNSFTEPAATCLLEHRHPSPCCPHFASCHQHSCWTTHEGQWAEGQQLDPIPHTADSFPLTLISITSWD